LKLFLIPRIFTFTTLCGSRVLFHISMLLDQINGIIKVWDYLVHDAYEMHSDFELGDHVEEAPADES